jgi:hypothetical protein
MIMGSPPPGLTIRNKDKQSRKTSLQFRIQYILIVRLFIPMSIDDLMHPRSVKMRHSAIATVFNENHFANHYIGAALEKVN